MNHQFNAPEAKARRRAQLRRGMYLLPSLFTAGSLALGFFSIMQTIEAISRDTPLHLDWAAIAILIAIPFDALDGRIARMTNTASDFGKEFDSLADLISFGMAPSLLAYVWGIHFLPDSINPQLRQHLVQDQRLHVVLDLRHEISALMACRHQDRLYVVQCSVVLSNKSSAL